MTIQAIFNRVYKHFILGGGKPSFLMRDGKIECLYRDEAGNKCAVGLFIPDEDYCVGMEGRAASDLLDPRWFGGKLPTTQKILLEELQYAHDTTVDECLYNYEDTTEGTIPSFVDQLKYRLEEIASRRSLRIPNR